MSEEQEQGGGFFSNLKNQIITGAGAILATMGTIFIDEIKSIAGIEDETEQVQGTQQNNQQNQSVIINIPEQKPVSGGTTKIIEREKVVEKPVEKAKKKEGEEFKEEAPKW